MRSAVNPHLTQLYLKRSYDWVNPVNSGCYTEYKFHPLTGAKPELEQDALHADEARRRWRLDSTAPSVM